MADLMVGHGKIEGAAAPVFTAAKVVATTVVGVVIIAFLTLFMLLEGPDWRRRIDEIVPERSRGRVSESEPASTRESAAL